MKTEEICDKAMVDALKNANNIQTEAHKLIEELMKENDTLSYQDCMNVVLIKKIGELQSSVTLLYDVLKPNK